MIEFQPKEEVDESIINMIVKIGIQEKYPVYLGKTVKYFLQNDYKISEQTFQEFVLFLEKCKGYEEDAKRFIFLVPETQNLDFTYKLVRPLFKKTIGQGSGNEILKLFEQLRKNIKLNKSKSTESLNP